MYVITCCNIYHQGWNEGGLSPEARVKPWGAQQPFMSTCEKLSMSYRDVSGIRVESHVGKGSSCCLAGGASLPRGIIRKLGRYKHPIKTPASLWCGWIMGASGALICPPSTTPPWYKCMGFSNHIHSANPPGWESCPKYGGWWLCPSEFTLSWEDLIAS